MDNPHIHTQNAVYSARPLVSRSQKGESPAGWLIDLILDLDGKFSENSSLEKGRVYLIHTMISPMEIL